jgi:uncharacterized protein YqjF (DUF2071 family)
VARLRPSEILAQTAHRPWAVPSGAWVQRQSWNDFLFCHWPVPVAAIRAVVPAALPLDLWEGEAWLGIIPFHMSGVTLRGLPDLPRFSAFPELNVRTYVRVGDRAGVYFLSLEADNRLAVFLARRWFGLPYHRARMAWRKEGPRAIHFQSQRVHPGSPPAAYEAVYQWSDQPRDVARGSFEHWLTERYALYVVDRRDQIRVGHVHHHPWPIRAAEVEIRTNTLAAAHGLVLPDTAPHVLYAPGVDVVVWNPAAAV